MSNARYVQDPEAKLDWTVNWADWLGARGGDTIVTATALVTKGTGTLTNVTNDGATVTFWLSDALEGLLNVTINIITAAGREDERSMEFSIKHQ